RIFKVDACGYWNYIIDGVSYLVPNYGYVAIIYGYNGLTQSTDNDTRKKYNIKESLVEYGYKKLINIVKNLDYDLHLEKYKYIDEIFLITPTSKLKSKITSFDWIKDVFNKFVFFRESNYPVKYADVNIIDKFESSKHTPYIDGYDENGNIYGLTKTDIPYHTIHLSDTVDIKVNNYGFDINGFNGGGYNKYGYNKYGFDI